MSESAAIVFAVAVLAGWWPASVRPSRIGVSPIVLMTTEGAAPSRRVRARTEGWARPRLRTLCVVSIPVVVIGLLASPALTVSVVVAALVVARVRRRAALSAEQSRLGASLPESIDLCTVVLGAGGTIRDCVDALALHGPVPVRPAVVDALDDADLGRGLHDALQQLRVRLGPSFHPLTGALLLALQEGGSVGSLLDRLAVEANAGRRRNGERRARRLPVVLLIPLVTCSLPAVVIGTVVPLAIVALGRVGS